MSIEERLAKLEREVGELRETVLRVAKTAQPAPLPVRVYDLARKFDMPNNKVLEICREMGVSAKSHSTVIPGEAVDRVRSRLAKEKRP
jgi:hypothetical protein